MATAPTVDEDAADQQQAPPQEVPPQQDPRLAALDSALAKRHPQTPPAGGTDPRLAKLDSVLGTLQSRRADPPPMPYAPGPDGGMVPKASIPPEQPGFIDRAVSAVRSIFGSAAPEQQEEPTNTGAELRGAASALIAKTRSQAAPIPSAYPGLPGDEPQWPPLAQLKPPPRKVFDYGPGQQEPAAPTGEQIRTQAAQVVAKVRQQTQDAASGAPTSPAGGAVDTTRMPAQPLMPVARQFKDGQVDFMAPPQAAPPPPSGLMPPPRGGAAPAPDATHVGQGPAEQAASARAAEEAKVPLADKMVNAVAMAYQSGASIPADVLEMSGIAARSIESALGAQGGDQPASTQAMYQAGQAVRSWAQRVYPGDPRLQKSFLYTAVPQVFGQQAAFVLASAGLGELGGAIGAARRTAAALGPEATGTALALPDEAVAGAGQRALEQSAGAGRATGRLIGQTGAAATLMGASGAAATYKEAVAAKASEHVARVAAGWGATVGAAMSAPIGMVLGRYNPDVVSSLGQAIANSTSAGARGALEMTVAQTLGKVGYNEIAQQLYDKDRPLAEGVLDAGGSGMAVGFIASFLASMAGVRFMPPQAEPEVLQGKPVGGPPADQGPDYETVSGEPGGPPPQPGGAPQEPYDPHAILGVSPRAPNAEVEQVFRQRMAEASADPAATVWRDNLTDARAAIVQGRVAAATGAAPAPAAEPVEATPSGLSVPEQRAAGEVQRRIALAKESGQSIDPDQMAMIYQQYLAGSQPAVPPSEVSQRLDEEHAAAAEQAAKQASEQAQSAPRGVTEVDPTRLDLDPARFQYKEANPVTGSTGALEGVEKWDENKAGIVLAWRDPADGRLKVVNGHQRVNLARQLGVPKMLVREIRAPNAEEARYVGALVNIAEGSGTAVDAAKLLRERGGDQATLDAAGVPRRSKVGRDGVALSKLHDGLFDLVARGKMPVDRAAVIGRSGLSPEQQMGLYDLLKKQKREPTNTEVEELARFVKSAGSEEVSQETLFGTDTQAQSLALEKARQSAWLIDRLGKQARLFKFVSKGERAGTIEAEGAGKIDTEKAGSLGTEAAQVLEVYRRLSASAGPVSDALNQAVREVKDGTSEQLARAKLLRSVKRAVQEVLAGHAGSSGDGSEGPSAGAAPDEGPGLALGEESPRYGEARPAQVGEGGGSLVEQLATLRRDQAARVSRVRAAMGKDGGALTVGDQRFIVSRNPDPSDREHPWRVTHFRTIDGAMTPTGHTVHRMLDDQAGRGGAYPDGAVQEVANNLPRRVGPAVREEVPAYGGAPTPFYSRLERAITKAPFASAPAEQWLGYLNNQSISGAEKEWTGVARVLSEGTKWTRDDLLTLMQKHGVRLTETVLGGKTEAPPELMRELEEASTASDRAHGALAAERDKFSNVMRDHAYTESEIADYRRGGGRAYPPVGEFTRQHDNARAQAGIVIHTDEDDLGFDRTSQALDALAKEKDFERAWPDLSPRAVELVRRMREARAALMAAAAGPAPTDVQVAHDKLHALEDAAQAAERRWRTVRDAVSEATRVGQAKWAQYTEPGGTNYREILVQLGRPQWPGAGPDAATLPEGYEPTVDRSQEADKQWAVTPPGQVHGAPWSGRHPTKEAALQSALDTYNFLRRSHAYDAWKDAHPVYNSGHFDQPDILTHIRVKDRTAPDGEKVLFAEEIQSDWAQQGRKRGFAEVEPPEVVAASQRVIAANEKLTVAESHLYPESAEAKEAVAEYRAAHRDLAAAREAAGLEVNKNPNAVPDQPFKKTEDWVELAVKRLLAEAASGGYDRIAWTPGAMAADRYNLRKYVEHVVYEPPFQHGPGRGNLQAFDSDGREVLSEAVPPEKLADYIGKEAAERLLATAPDEDGLQHLTGQDLQVGGEGMVAFYDKIIPTVAKKYVRTLDPKATIEPIRMSFKATSEPWGSLTDEQRKAALAGEDAHDVLSIPITPAMRAKIQGEGQRLMERGPEYGTKKLPPMPERTADDEIVYLRSTGRARDAKRANALERFMVGSQVRNVVFRGDSRVDQMGDRFKVGRTTSGRFYFTDDPEIASKYVEKPGAAHEGRVDYSGWFKLDVGERKPVPFVAAWWRLTPEQRARVEDVARRAVENEHGELVLGDEKEPLGPGGEPALPNGYVAYGRDRTENWLQVLKDGWLDSGALFNEEERFGQLLDWAGLSHEYDSPWRVQGGVTPVYLAIRKPIDAEKPPADFVAAVRAAAARSRTPGKSGVDTWDKTSRSLREWLQMFDENVADGSDTWATSIPEQVTKVAQRLGYDGVRHEGGRSTSGKRHDVWIAFEPTQIKSAIGNRGTFDPTKANVLREPGADYGTDLFGNQQPRQEQQGDLLGTGGPQGVTAALDQARATVSALDGKVARGEASPTEQRRHAEARSLIRRQEGKGLAGDEVRPAETAQEPAGEKPLDLFGGLRDRMKFLPTPDQSPAQDEKLTYGSTGEAAKARARTQAYNDALRPEGRRASLEREPLPWVDVRGHKLPRSRDPARMARAVRDIMAPFRNGKNEVHAFTLVDDAGAIKAFTTETSGAIDFVNLWSGGRGKTKAQVMAAIRRMVHEVAERARRSGATAVISSHNHPSGDPTASGADKAYSATVGKMFDEEGIHYVGSVVIDDTKANVVMHDENWNTGVEEVSFAGPGDSPWLGASATNLIIREPGDAAAEFKRLVPMRDDGAALLYLDTARRTVAVEPMRPARIANMEAWFAQKLREMGAQSAIVVVGPEAGALYDQAIEGVNAHGLQTSEGPIFDPRTGGVLDVIQVGSGSRYRSAVKEQSIIPVPRADDDRPARRLREEPGSYRAGDPPVRTGRRPKEVATREEDDAGEDIKALLRHTFAVRAHRNDVAAAELEQAVSDWEGPAARAEGGKLLFGGPKPALSESKARIALRDKARAEIVDFVDAIERGDTSKMSPKQKAAAETVRRVLDRLTGELRKRDLIQTFHENYFGRIWREPDEGVLGKIFGKRPLRGPRGFQKKRSYDFFRQGVDAGLEPVDWNPFGMELHKIAEMSKAITAHDFIQEAKERSLIHHEPGRVPDGFARINDEAFTSYQRGPKGETILRGHWVAPDDVARVLNRYLTPSPIANMGFVKAIRFTQNAMNQLQLLGLFHAGTVSIDSMVGRGAIGLVHAFEGAKQLGAGNIYLAGHEIGKAFRAALSVPVAPVLQAVRGNAVMRAWRMDPTLLPPEARDLIEAIERGGGRVGVEAIYKTRAIKAFRRALYLHTPVGMLKAVGWATPAAMEAATRPLFEWYVPRVKLAAFADMARFNLEHMPGGALMGDVMEQRKAMQDAWRSVDERAGQVVYDNLFWDPTLKLAGQLGFRSVGWNWGSLSLAARGAGQAPFVFKGAPKWNAAYLFSLMLTVGALDGLLQYLMTGKPPETIKDLAYPRTGGVLPDGTEERMALPTYIASYYGWGAHPIKTAGHKLSPLLNSVTEMLQNEDFYGTQIVNPDAPWPEQLKELGGYAARTATPLSARSFQQFASAGKGPAAAAAAAVGVQAAPADVRRSAFQTFLAEHYVATLPRGARTPTEADRAKQATTITKALRDARALPPEDRGDVLAEAGFSSLSPADQKRALSRANLTADEYRFQRLPLTMQVRAYEMATPEERTKNRLINHILDIRVKNGSLEQNVPAFTKRLANLPADERATVVEEIKKIRQEAQSQQGRQPEASR